jgi:hypothetical protein
MPIRRNRLLISIKGALALPWLQWASDWVFQGRAGNADVYPALADVSPRLAAR